MSASQTPKALREMAVEVPTSADGRDETALSRRHAAAWFAAREAGAPLPLGRAEPPGFPARPARRELLDPRDVPRRRPGSAHGRLAILHAVAHVELDAADLHRDIVARVADTPMPLGFLDDWVQAADEKSQHFKLMCDCLEAHGGFCGALPAHAGTWRAAEDAAQDIMGRPAVVPMVPEARGLDVTPGMIALFERACRACRRRAGGGGAAGDPCRAGAPRRLWLEVVSFPLRLLCGRHELDPKDAFHRLVQRLSTARSGRPATSRNAPQPGCRPVSTGQWPKPAPRAGKAEQPSHAPQPVADRQFSANLTTHGANSPRPHRKALPSGTGLANQASGREARNKHETRPKRGWEKDWGGIRADSVCKQGASLA